MKFRDLLANEIDVRVCQVGDGYCTLLLYKDARVDMDILDETVGSERWQRKHYEVKGNMYCSVSIFFENLGWVEKDDCGTESYTEKEKGESSDSFKRACVNWGIGRELYTAPLIKVNCKTESKKISELTSFAVENIIIENKVIVGLSIKAYNKENRTNDIVFSFGKCKNKIQMTFEEAKAYKFTSNGVEHKVGELSKENLEYLQKYAKSETLKQAVNIVLGNV